jgi:hypothetical protein
MDNLGPRLNALYESLADFKPNDDLSPQVGTVFNALLQAAKTERPDDSVLSAIAPVDIEMGQVFMNAGSMRTTVQQILAALGTTGRRGPSLA